MGVTVQVMLCIHEMVSLEDFQTSIRDIYRDSSDSPWRFQQSVNNCTRIDRTGFSRLSPGGKELPPVLLYIVF